LEELNYHPGLRLKRYHDGRRKDQWEVTIWRKQLVRQFRSLDVNNLDATLLGEPESKVAFLQGLFDAEGHVKITGNCVVANITNTNLPLVELGKRLGEQLGFGLNIQGPYSSKRPHHRPAYRLYIGAQNWPKFLALIQPLKGTV
jgi:hypothetical protein